ncbi:MAG: nitrous oxide reductase accessory protein NosL [Flavobacteriales bacterium]
MKTTLFNTLIILLLASGCGKTQEAIEYGKDNCHYCQMRIMDPKFGSEAITNKGRCYKFDSGECLLRYLNDAQSEHSHLYVTDFERPNKLIDAKSAYFLVSKAMPSPMGGFLNAFSDKASAEKQQTKNGGEIFDWDGIKEEHQK